MDALIDATQKNIGFGSWLEIEPFPSAQDKVQMATGGNPGIIKR